jgi:hypothetical protein
MRFEIEVAMASKRFVYSVSFDWPDNFREARILDESLFVDGQSVFTRKQAQVDLTNGNNFGLDWHVFALPVINEKPPARSVQDLKSFLASLMLLAPVPGSMTGFSDQPTAEMKEDGSNFASCLRSLLEKKPAAYGAFDAYLRSVIRDFSAIENEDRGKDGKQLMVTFKRSDSEEVLKVEFTAAHQILHGDFMKNLGLLSVQLIFHQEHGVSAFDHVPVNIRNGTETATLHEKRLVVKEIGRLDHLPITAEEDGLCQSLGDKLQTHDPIVDHREVRT